MYVKSSEMTLVLAVLVADVAVAIANITTVA